VYLFYAYCSGKVFKTKVQVLCGLVEEQLSGLVEVTSVLTFVRYIGIKTATPYV